MEFILNSGSVVLIDESDLPSLLKYKWGSNNGYIFRTVQKDGVRTRHYLHRELLNAPEGLEVDHINGNPSDNRRSNIRLCTSTENNRNRRKPITALNSAYKGVKGRRGKFEASIGRGESYNYLGTYETEVEAAIAYNEKASELFGDFTNLNVVPSELADIIPKRYEGTSSFRGVMFHKRIKKWQAAIQHDKKRRHIGYFDTDSEAALAYNDYARELHGSKAKLNVVNPY